VKKTFVVTRNILGVAGLLLAGYVLVTSLPDLGRYIKISRMSSRPRLLGSPNLSAYRLHGPAAGSRTSSQSGLPS